VHAFSAQAKERIEAAGGTCEVIHLSQDRTAPGSEAVEAGS
jgi:ribosomal protein L18E